uniref:Reverse transcriptase domain-containing protein n=1 Tax=Tanacetum cinerariifolium TaxID=118510 RepID=A0A6L2M9W1_TANCI|nr:hypothetical protein [Tanacetum cinerariifolium]
MNQNFYNSSGFDQIQPPQYLHAQPEDTHELLRKLLEDLQIISEELAEYINSPSWNRPAFYDDDDEYSIQYKEYLENSSNVIAPVLPTEEPDNSLSIGDEHLSTIPETESDEVIKAGVKNLVPIPSEFEVTSDNDSDDDESLSNEDVPMENFKIYLNPLFDDEEIISTKIDPHYFNAKSNLIESLLNRDTLIDSSPKFDYLFKLAHNDSIPPGIEEADFDLEEEIRLVENLLYDNSSPRPPEDLNVVIVVTILESPSPYPIAVEDSDSQMEEIDLFLATDDLMPPVIQHLSSRRSVISSSSSGTMDAEVFFDFEPDTGVLTAKVVEDISEHCVLMPKVLPTLPALCLNINTLLLFSFENEDKVSKPSILSYLLVSHRDKTISDFSENPIMMYGENIPHLDVSFLHFYPP